MYKERRLTSAERRVAHVIYENISDNMLRLHAAQDVAEIADNTRELARGNYKRSVFPRYRFLAIATGHDHWLQFAEESE